VVRRSPAAWFASPIRNQPDADSSIPLQQLIHPMLCGKALPSSYSLSPRAATNNRTLVPNACLPRKVEAISPPRSKILPIYRPAARLRHPPPARLLKTQQPPQPLSQLRQTLDPSRSDPAAPYLFLLLPSYTCTVGTQVDHPTYPECLSRPRQS
jgi:hypothetical protein